MSKKQGEEKKKAESKFYDEILNTRIRELMKNNNIKVKDLAKKMSISSESVRQWTGGYSQPTIKKIIEMSKIFNVSTDYLLGNSNSPSISLTYKKITDSFGISKTTLNKLALWKKYAKFNNNNFKFEILNFMFEDNFLDTLFDKFIMYYNSLKYPKEKYEKLEKEFNMEPSNICRYALEMTFEKFIDKSCEKFITTNKKENKQNLNIKQNYLFDMEEEDFEKYFLDLEEE